jgi:hypothetical protein
MALQIFFGLFGFCRDLARFATEWLVALIDSRETFDCGI